MSRELPSFGEGLSPEIIRAEPAPSPSPASPPPFDKIPPAPPLSKGGTGGFASAPLTPEDLAALLCRVPYVRLASGEEGEVVLSAADWRRILDAHHLMITRRIP